MFDANDHRKHTGFTCSSFNEAHSQDKLDDAVPLLKTSSHRHYKEANVDIISLLHAQSHIQRIRNYLNLFSYRL